MVHVGMLLFGVEPEALRPMQSDISKEENHREHALVEVRRTPPASYSSPHLSSPPHLRNGRGATCGTRTTVNGIERANSDVFSENKTLREKELNIAFVGLIKQSIMKHQGWNGNTSGQESAWDVSRTKVFNVQILNTAYFRQVTGLAAPKTPIDMKTSTKLGIPFYSMDEELTDISGNFSGVRSIAQMNGALEPEASPSKTRNISTKRWFSRSASAPSKSTTSAKLSKAARPTSHLSTHKPVQNPPTPQRTHSRSSASCRIGEEFFNPEGPMSPFGCLSTLERELRAKEIVKF